MTKNKYNNSTNFNRFNLGELEITIMSDGYQIMKPAHPIFGPTTKPEIIKELLQQNFRQTEQVNLSINIMLIKKQNQLILIDSGLGSEESTAGYLQQSLIFAGFKSTDITDIIITHCHLDHIAGLVNQKKDLAFPNATIYLAETEYDFWTSSKPDFSKSFLQNNPALISKMVSKINDLLNIIKPKLKLTKQDAVLFECIRLISAPGHTPGHTLLDIFSHDEKILHIADLIHSDVLLFTHPEWGFLFDTDFDLAITTRKNMLEILEKSKVLIFAYHLPWPGLGHVSCDHSAFKWIPKVYDTPFDQY
ncbi:MBL fold metallo-hydrolase [Flavobacterium chilense]|uniref:Glyoxylase, beta-lactamase superfamily II n=1 Tax=Flavobacterium chilense TaxID=946677 RepID=A0A1M7CIS4_9FLAO|nr:MBL fold metallo-hydrolase [Flavobacterium chilense]SHL67115.1 Glyoxylase, beta-lactamase superfamily II [Flavobacterium chilense]